MKKKYFIESGRYCYPYQMSQAIHDWGVLEEYIGKKYTRDEMDKVICELIMRHPYVNGAMNVDINIMWSEGNIKGFYHRLSFHQEQKDYFHQEKDTVIKFEK